MQKFGKSFSPKLRHFFLPGMEQRGSWLFLLDSETLMRPKHPPSQQQTAHWGPLRTAPWVVTSQRQLSDGLTSWLSASVLPLTPLWAQSRLLSSSIFLEASADITECRMQKQETVFADLTREASPISPSGVFNHRTQFKAPLTPTPVFCSKGKFDFNSCFAPLVEQQ